MEALHDCLIDDSLKDVARDLGKMLHSVFDVDDVGKILKQVCNGERRETCLPEIEEASGKFQVLANLVVTR